MSSLVRRMQIRAMKLANVSKVPFGSTTLWPRKVKGGSLYPTNPKAKDLIARLDREQRRKK